MMCRQLNIADAGAPDEQECLGSNRDSPFIVEVEERLSRHRMRWLQARRDDLAAQRRKLEEEKWEVEEARTILREQLERVEEQRQQLVMELLINERAEDQIRHVVIKELTTSEMLRQLREGEPGPAPGEPESEAEEDEGPLGKGWYRVGGPFPFEPSCSSR